MLGFVKRPPCIVGLSFPVMARHCADRFFPSLLHATHIHTSQHALKPPPSHTLPCRAVESRVESLAAKALGNRARLVRVFRRTLPRSPPGGGGKPMKESALVPEQEHILLGVQVRQWGWWGSR